MANQFERVRRTSETPRLSDYAVTIYRVEGGPWIFEVWKQEPSAMGSMMRVHGNLQRTGRAESYVAASYLAGRALRESCPSRVDLL